MGAVRDAVGRVALTILTALLGDRADRALDDAGPDTWVGDLLTGYEPHPRRTDGGPR
ncbi:MAG TPA: hypothetical protein VFM54_13325 [Micromonosporaceae bacterium]|nr:hypothetical protein [Micromonosporaceae bacterium]